MRSLCCVNALWALEDTLAWLLLKCEPREKSSRSMPASLPSQHSSSTSLHRFMFLPAWGMTVSYELIGPHDSPVLFHFMGREKPISIITQGVSGEWGVQIHPPQLVGIQPSPGCPWCLQRSPDAGDKVIYECLLCSTLCTDSPGNTSRL